MLKTNPKNITNMLLHFLQQEMGKIGMNQAVIGLSGGVDSAVVAALLVRAFGPEHVHAIAMPYRESNPDSE